MKLTERGIYRLPNGRELVAIDRSQNGSGSYKLVGWGNFESAEYEINHEGRLTCNGKLTAWGIANLKDTGRMADAFMASEDREVSEDAARAESR